MTTHEERGAAIAVLKGRPLAEISAHLDMILDMAEHGVKLDAEQLEEYSKLPLARMAEHLLSEAA